VSHCLQLGLGGAGWEGGCGGWLASDKAAVDGSDQEDARTGKGVDEKEREVVVVVSLVRPLEALDSMLLLSLGRVELPQPCA